MLTVQVNRKIFLNHLIDHIALCEAKEEQQKKTKTVQTGYVSFLNKRITFLAKFEI